jgi:hypothetical protein
VAAVVKDAEAVAVAVELVLLLRIPLLPALLLQAVLPLLKPAVDAVAFRLEALAPAVRLLSISRGIGSPSLLKTGLNACLPIRLLPEFAVVAEEAVVVVVAEHLLLRVAVAVSLLHRTANNAASMPLVAACACLAG